MWLHLQTDESVGSVGFKVNYKGKYIFFGRKLTVIVKIMLR